MTITRFAPSPTGFIHVGNLRTALMNYLIARKTGGTFILRLDDTDQERSKQEYADGIKEDLEWLGLTWDRIEKQSDRFERYREAADDLRRKGSLYEVFETPTELDLKRKKLLNMGKPPVYDRAGLKLSATEKEALRADREGYWRFQLDQKRTEWTDGILGPVSIDTASVSDPVLIRADGQILYTFASSVDDVDMAVTHIVRGADHVTNTATQIQIMHAMGGTPPAFAHHSLLTGAQGDDPALRGRPRKCEPLRTPAGRGARRIHTKVLAHLLDALSSNNLLAHQRRNMKRSLFSSFAWLSLLCLVPACDGNVSSGDGGGGSAGRSVGPGPGDAGRQPRARLGHARLGLAIGVVQTDGDQAVAQRVLGAVHARVLLRVGGEDGAEGRVHLDEVLALPAAPRQRQQLLLQHR